MKRCEVCGKELGVQAEKLNMLTCGRPCLILKQTLQSFATAKRKYEEAKIRLKKVRKLYKQKKLGFNKKKLKDIL